MHACSTKTAGPREFIFGTEVVRDGGPLIFYISRSRVKGQGHLYLEMCLFAVNCGHRGYVWVISEQWLVKERYIWQLAKYYWQLAKSNAVIEGNL